MLLIDAVDVGRAVDLGLLALIAAPPRLSATPLAAATGFVPFSVMPPPTTIDANPVPPSPNHARATADLSAGRIATFRHVILPLTLPGVGTGRGGDGGGPAPSPRRPEQVAPPCGRQRPAGRTRSDATPHPLWRSPRRHGRQPGNRRDCRPTGPEDRPDRMTPNLPEGTP